MAARDRDRCRRGSRGERQTVDRQPDVVADRGLEHVRALGQLERRTTGRDHEPGRGGRRVRESGDAHRYWTAVDRDQVGATPAVDGTRADRLHRHAGHTERRDSDRLDTGAVGSVELRLFGSDAVDRHPDGATVQCRELDAYRRGRVLGGLITNRGNRHLTALAVGVDTETGGDGVATVGDHREVEMIDRQRCCRLHLGPLTLGRVERGLPGGGRSIVEGGVGPAREASGQEPARRERQTGMRVAREQRLFDCGVGRVRAHRRVPGQLEGARGGEIERPRDRELGLRARRHRPNRIAVHDEHQRMIARRRSQRTEKIVGHLHDLVHAEVLRRVHVAQADLGESDRVVLTEEVRSVIVGLGDANRERVERATREGDRLARGATRAGVEDDVDRRAAVEDQLRVGDETVG